MYECKSGQQTIGEEQIHVHFIHFEHNIYVGSNCLIKDLPLVFELLLYVFKAITKVKYLQSIINDHKLHVHLKINNSSREQLNIIILVQLNYKFSLSYLFYVYMYTARVVSIF